MSVTPILNSWKRGDAPNGSVIDMDTTKLDAATAKMLREVAARRQAAGLVTVIDRGDGEKFTHYAATQKQADDFRCRAGRRPKQETRK